MESLPSQTRRPFGSLQRWLWGTWICAIVAVALIDWYRAQLAHRALNDVGLVVHIALIGVLGMLLITLVEIRLEPWRFVDRS